MGTFFSNHWYNRNSWGESMKKRLILYAGKYKTTKECAQLLADKFYEHVKLCSIADVQSVSLQDYDQIIFGASVHESRISRKMNQWIKKHQNHLLHKEIGIFLCAYHDEKCGLYMKLNFPIEILEQAKVKMCFGAHLDYSTMSWLDRFLMKLIQFFDQEEIVTKVYKERIHYFAREMAKGEETYE